jgi:hemoglobin
MSTDADEAAARRNLIVADIVERTGIDMAMIERLVRAFYGRARGDPLIGPVFARHVADWDAHIPRICDFWSSVALMSGRYHGQPMTAHLPLPIDTPHFDRWLDLFAETAREVCPPAAAALFIDRAYRIADSLEFGIAAQKGEIRSRRERSASIVRLSETGRRAERRNGHGGGRRQPWHATRAMITD